MYQESVFSSRPGHTKLSNTPFISSTLIPIHGTNSLTYRFLKLFLPKEQNLLRAFDFARCPTFLLDEKATDEIKNLNLERMKEYGAVIRAWACPIDPIEAGAEFHEDSLEDRPRYAFGYSESIYWSWFMVMCCWLSLGIVWVILRWFPLFKFLIIHRPCRLIDATHIVIRTEKGEEHMVKLLRTYIYASEAEKFDAWPPICCTCFGVIQPCISHKASVDTTDEIDSSYYYKLRNDKSDLILNKRLCMCRTRDTQNYCYTDSDNESTMITLFNFKFIRYYLNYWDNAFEVAQFDSQLPPVLLHQTLGRGLWNKHVFESRKKIFGLNAPLLSPLWQNIIEEITEPFYVFQLLSIAMWFWDDYSEYAGVVLALTVLSTCYDITNYRRSESDILKLFITASSVNVFREWMSPITLSRNKLYGSEFYSNEDLLCSMMTRIDGNDLQPGDLFEIEVGTIMPCDAVILWGSAVVSETVLSGEHIPITKIALPGGHFDYIQTMKDSPTLRHEMTTISCSTESSSSHDSRTTCLSGEDVVTSFKIDQDTHCSLYASTEILSLPRLSRGKRVLALAIRTHFLSCHGRLMRSLLLPTTTHLDFNKQAMRFMTWLFLVTLFGVIISVTTGILYEFPRKIILIRSLDLFTDSIPPALPAVLSIGVIVAINRLRFHFNVDCINAARVNLAGKVNTFVFDKTGTLTQQGLEFGGCLEVENCVFPYFAPTKGRRYASSGLDTLFPIKKPYRSSGIVTNAKLLSREGYKHDNNGLALHKSSSNTSLSRLQAGTVKGYIQRKKLFQVTQSGNINDARKIGYHLPVPNDPLILQPRLGVSRFKPDKIGLRFIQAIATCHTTTLINGEPVGDNLELRMLKFTGWQIHDVSSEVQDLLDRENDQDYVKNNEKLETMHTNDSLKLKEIENAVIEGINELYDCGDTLPTIVKPFKVQLSVLQLLRRGITVNDMRRVRAIESHSQTKSSVSNGEHTKHMGLNAKQELLRQYFPHGRSELGILRRFGFSSALQRISVIVRDPLTQELFAFCKGSPEVLSDLCQFSSIPTGFHSSVAQFTQRGARVIAVAGKPLGRLSGRGVASLTRTEIETKLTLLGCLIFANRLKPDTKNAIHALLEARCRCVIATGDNPLTALAVAKECGLVKDVRESNKEIILGDLYVPRTHLTETRVGQRSYFVWTKVERLPEHHRQHLTSSFVQSLTTRVPNDEKTNWRTRDNYQHTIDNKTFHSDSTKMNNISHTTDKKTFCDIQETLMKRMLAAHTRKLTTLDLRDFLRGKNPRDFEYILTGRAFRKLRMLHEEMNLSWFGYPKINDIRPSCDSIGMSGYNIQTSLPTKLQDQIATENNIFGSSHSSRVTTSINDIAHQTLKPPVYSRAHNEFIYPTQTFNSNETSDCPSVQNRAFHSTPHSHVYLDLASTTSSHSSMSSKKTRSRCEQTTHCHLGRLIGRFRLQKYEDPVASSIIFGAQNHTIPTTVSKSIPGIVPASFFSERSSWVSMSSFGFRQGHGNTIPPRLAFAAVTANASLRRKKPIRNPVGPPAQAIRAAQAGTVRYPFPSRNVISKSPKKTIKKNGNGISERPQFSKLMHKLTGVAEESSKDGRSHLAPTERRPTRLSPSSSSQHVFWFFDGRLPTSSVLGLKVSEQLPDGDQPPPLPASVLASLKRTLRQFGLLTEDESDTGSDEEAFFVCTTQQRKAVWGAKSLKKITPTIHPYMIDCDTDNQSVMIPFETYKKMSETPKPTTTLMAQWLRRRCTTTPKKEVILNKKDTKRDIGKLFHKKVHDMNSKEPLLASPTFWHPPPRHPSRFITNLSPPLEEMTTNVGLLETDNRQAIQQDNNNKGHILPIVSSNNNDMLQFESNCAVLKLNDLSSCDYNVQSLPLSEVSYAESQALSHTATSLHFHPEFAFPTRSSYAGPPCSRHPGLSHCVSEIDNMSHGYGGVEKIGNIQSCYSELSNCTGRSIIPIKYDECGNARNFPATSRLAHKGLIPATNEELMLLIVVVVKQQPKKITGRQGYTDTEIFETKTKINREVLSPRISDKQNLFGKLFLENDINSISEEDKSTNDSLEKSLFSNIKTTNLDVPCTTSTTNTQTITEINNSLPYSDSFEAVSTIKNLLSPKTPRKSPVESTLNLTGSRRIQPPVSYDCQETPPLSINAPELSDTTENASSPETTVKKTLAFEEVEYELVRMSLFEFLLRNTKIYTRMSPGDKTSLLTALKSLPGSPAIGMCGDSANDCGALRAADIGVSLNDAAASVVAPFASREKSVQSCVDILREGRASLSNAFQMFKFVIFYSIVQYSSVVLLYLYGLNFTDYQYIFVDFAIILPISFFLSETAPTTKLNASLPNANLLSKSFVYGIILQSLVAIFFMIALLIGLRSTPGWRPFEATVDAGDSSGAEIASYENTALFYLTNIQYMILCGVSLSQGAWRQGIYTNIHFMLWIILLLFVFIGLIIIPRPATILLPTWSEPSPNPIPIPPYAKIGWLKYSAVFLDQWLVLVSLPSPAKLFILALAGLQLIVAASIEAIIIAGFREVERLETKSTRSIDRGAIPRSSPTVNAFHIL